MPGVPELHIERREFKYLIDEAMADRVRAAIQPFCHLDPNAAARPGGRYTIQSLYLDTSTWACLRAVDNEQRDRYKCRVRTYPDALDPPVFFEVKRRYHDIMVKDRARVGAAWPRLLEGHLDALPDEDVPTERRAVERFVARVGRNHLRPVILIRYEREPWVSSIDSYGRVTFDRAIVAQEMRLADLVGRPDRWRPADVPRGPMVVRSPTVLELKFTTAVPRWLVHVVRRFDLTRGAFSKYGHGVRSFLHGPTLRHAPHSRMGP